MTNVITLSDCEEMPKIQTLLANFRQSQSFHQALDCLERFNDHFQKFRISLLRNDSRTLAAHFLTLPADQAPQHFTALSDQISILTKNNLTLGGLHDLGNMAVQNMNFPWLEMFIQTKPDIARVSLLKNMTHYSKWILDANKPPEETLAIGNFLFSCLHENDKNYRGAPQQKLIFSLVKLHQYKPEVFLSLATPKSFDIMDEFLQTSSGQPHQKSVSEMKKSWLAAHAKTATRSPDRSPSSPKF